MNQDVDNFLSAVLRGDPADFSSLHNNDFQNKFLERASAHGVLAVLYHQWRQRDDWRHCPDSVGRILREATYQQCHEQVLRQTELQFVFASLAQEGIRALLMKGASLSFVLYPEPYLRPSIDTDLLIQVSQKEKMTRILRKAGYIASNQISGNFVSYQDVFVKNIPDEAVHRLDIHTKISNPLLFSDLLTFEEIEKEAMPVPVFGPDVKTLCFEQALLLACVHRVAHHQDNERLIWLYDIHLLAEKVSVDQMRSFARLAKEKKVAAICARGLWLSKQWFGTAVSQELCESLRVEAGEHEPSAAYLRIKHQRLLSEFILNWQTLPTFEKKIRFLLECVFPSPDYMFKKYSTHLYLLLPFLYFFRLSSGFMKCLKRVR